jgi:hypothetical protein
MDDEAPEANQPEPDAEPVRSPFVTPPPMPEPATLPPRSKWRRARNPLIVVAVVIVVLAVISHIGRDKVSVSDIRPGTCIQEPHGSFSSAKKVDCTEPHYAEILGWINDVEVLSLTGAEPEAKGRCDALFTSYAGRPVDTTLYNVGYFTKSNAIVNSDVLCFVKSASDMPLTRPVGTTS